MARRLVVGHVSLPRYRYIAVHLGAPYTKIAELPLADVQWGRLRNGAGSFRAKLKMPNVRVPTTQEFVRSPDSNANFTITAGGDAVRTPGATDLVTDLTGDLDVRVKVTANDWTPGGFGQVFVSRWLGPANQSWFFSLAATGELQIGTSTDGANLLSNVSTVPTGFTDGSKHWIRATLDVDNGASQRVANFYTSDDGIDWIQLGATVTTAGVAVPIFNGAADVVIGDFGATALPLLGKIHQVQVRDGIDGPAIIDVNAQDYDDGTTAFTTTDSDGHSHDWVLTGAASHHNEPGPRRMTTVFGDNTEAVRLARLYKDATDRARTVIYVLRNNSPMGAYIVWDRTYDGDSQTYNIGGAELFSYFRRRLVEGNTLVKPVVYSQVPTMEIAADLIGRTNDILMVLDYEGDTPAADKTWKGTDSKWTGDAVLELANQADGFDFRTDLVLTDSGEFERRWVARPALGDVVGATAKWGATVPSMSVTQRGDIRSNEAVTLGSTVDEKIKMRPRGRYPTTVPNAGHAVEDEALEWLPRMQMVGQLNDEENTVRLFSYAQSLWNATVNHEVLAITMAATDVDTELGVLSPGDLVRFVLPKNVDPHFVDGIDTLIRTIGFEVSVPDTHGVEEITLLTDDDLDVLNA